MNGVLRTSAYFAPILQVIMVPATICIDNPHFYRATNMFLEPRIEHDFLTTMNITMGSGSTDKSHNGSGSTVPLLDIYGTSAINTLGLNLTDTSHNPYTELLKKLAPIASENDFATLSIDGQFKIRESNIFFVQNFTKGFFFLSHLPIRSLHIKDITFTDLSSLNASIPNQKTPEWQAVFRSLRPLLASFDISVRPTKEMGPGDFSCLVGWTHNYQNTSTLDFVDGTIATGFLAPTGKKRNPFHLFSLPLGYNGHWGFPLSAKLSLGMYEWITVGASIDAIIFAKNKQTIRLKTAPEQKGIIKLALGDVSVKKGSIWDAGLFFKADHFMYGLSFTAAYSCAGEQKDKLTPHNSTLFSKKIINTDTSLKNWYMHTLHVGGEYDFAKQYSKTGIRIGIFYNYQLGGVRVFDTNVVGGSFGIDIAGDL